MALAVNLRLPDANGATCFHQIQLQHLLRTVPTGYLIDPDRRCFLRPALAASFPDKEGIAIITTLGFLFPDDEHDIC